MTDGEPRAPNIGGLSPPSLDVQVSPYAGSDLDRRSRPSPLPICSNPVADLDRTFSSLLVEPRQTPLRSFGVGLVYVCAQW